MKNYRIDYSRNTITITREFADKANDITTEEYKILRQLKQDFPQFNVLHKTVKVSPTKKTHKGLTLDRMEKYIITFEPAEALTVFKKVKNYNTDIKENKDGDIVEIINYGKVKKWFLNKYPEYDKTEMAFDEMIETLEKLEAETASKTPLNQISTEETTEDEEAEAA